MVVNKSKVVFNGVTSYGEIPNVNIGDESFTRIIYFKRDNEEGRDIIWGDVQTGGIESNLELYSNKLRLYWNGGEINVRFGSIKKDIVYCVSVVRDIVKKKFYVYLDDELIYTHNSCGANITTNKPLRIGYDNRKETAFKGSLSQFSIWNRALSEEEIIHYRKMILSGREDGLIGYWKLDEGVGNISYDKVNNNDCILYSIAWSDDELISLNPSYYFFLKQDNLYYTFKDNELSLLENQSLTLGNFEANGFLYFKLLYNIVDKTNMKLLIYNAFNPNEMKLKYILKEPFRAIDKFDKNKPLEILKQEI